MSVKLVPFKKLNNSMYLEAKIPRRFFRSSAILDGSWFALEGMPSGAVFMHGQAFSISPPPQSSTRRGRRKHDLHIISKADQKFHYSYTGLLHYAPKGRADLGPAITYLTFLHDLTIHIESANL